MFHEGATPKKKTLKKKGWMLCFLTLYKSTEGEGTHFSFKVLNTR